MKIFCPIVTVTQKVTFLLIPVILDLETRSVLLLVRLPLCVIFTVCLAEIFCVDKRPTNLILIPVKKLGITPLYESKFFEFLILESLRTLLAIFENFILLKSQYLAIKWAKILLSKVSFLIRFKSKWTFFEIKLLKLADNISKFWEFKFKKLENFFYFSYFFDY